MKTLFNVFAKLLLLAATVNTVSCIGDEPLNMEADIVDFYFDNGDYISRTIGDTTIQLLFFEGADLSHLTPIIEVSAGATVTSDSIEPVSGFQDVIYVVTSQNGKWTKRYSAKVTYKIRVYDFEEWTATGSGNAVYPILSDLEWSNANQGVALAKLLGVSIDEFPTDRTEDAYEGKYAAKLQTIKGGKVMGSNIPIFAGSMFRGTFSANPASPLKSLRLGQAHPQRYGKPVLFTGYYKYTRGKVFTNKDGIALDGRKDSLSMYAAIFRVTKGAKPDEEYLDGETILTSERVVGLAQWRENAEHIVENEAAKGFTKFQIPFIYSEELDYDAYYYRMTVVCSSSKDGNLYEGAVGSTLIVDNLEVVCDPIP
ncbi:MAG: PCMD domain-containing protein [Cytophagaceae bacterium]|jgi:hypothetical protein|nr:PCMD domain-containing protein [Cytophagaceae bacterium]